MLAWLAQAPWLASLAPNGSVTVFDTALCFLLGGVALTPTAVHFDSRGRLRTFLACAIGLLAVLTLAENLLAFDAFYSREMNAPVAERLHFESRLRKGVERNQLMLHYQQNVDLKTRRIIGMEALMRWRDAENGFVSPLEFVPVLDQTGMIKCLASAGTSEEFCLEVLGALEKSMGGSVGVDLEITQSLIMEVAAASIEKLGQLRVAGQRIFMDDFGTWFSSLSQIAALPLDGLKIDRAFVAGMGKKPEAKAIVSPSLVWLARSK